MASEFDDDPATLDWGEQANTAVDEPVTVPAAPVVPEADTAKFQSLEWATGREAGFSDGLELALRSIGRELIEADFSPVDASAVIRRVRRGAIDRG